MYIGIYNNKFPFVLLLLYLFPVANHIPRLYYVLTMQRYRSLCHYIIMFKKKKQNLNYTRDSCSWLRVYYYNIMLAVGG